VRARVRGPTGARMSKQTSTNVHVGFDGTYIMHPHLLSRSPPRPAPLPLPFPILVHTHTRTRQTALESACVCVCAHERARVRNRMRASRVGSRLCRLRLTARARVLAGLLFARVNPHGKQIASAELPSCSGLLLSACLCALRSVQIPTRCTDPRSRTGRGSEDGRCATREAATQCAHVRTRGAP